MNSIVLLGRLTRDPEVRYTATGKVNTSFTLAVDRPFTNQAGEREADFINCVIWGKPAETLGNTVSKGQRLLVEGRLQIRSYDGKDGQKHWITEVIVNSFEYIERRPPNQPGNAMPPNFPPPPPSGSGAPAGNNNGAPGLPPVYVPFDYQQGTYQPTNGQPQTYKPANYQQGGYQRANNQSADYPSQDYPSVTKAGSEVPPNTDVPF